MNGRNYYKQRIDEGRFVFDGFAIQGWSDSDQICVSRDQHTSTYTKPSAGGGHVSRVVETSSSDWEVQITMARGTKACDLLQRRAQEIYTHGDSVSLLISNREGKTLIKDEGARIQELPEDGHRSNYGVHIAELTLILPNPESEVIPSLP